MRSMSPGTSAPPRALHHARSRHHAARYGHELARQLIVPAKTRPSATSHPARTGPSRSAPCTSGPAELREEVRGQGGQKTIGELVTCPFCTSVWIATGLTAGLVFAPRGTRLVTAMLSSLAGADLLQERLFGGAVRHRELAQCLQRLPARGGG